MPFFEDIFTNLDGFNFSNLGQRQFGAPASDVLFQDTFFEQSEVIDQSNFVELGVAPPIAPLTPILVNSPELTAETDNDIPVSPPVFFPTVIEQPVLSTIKVSDGSAVSPVSVPDVLQSVSTAQGSAGLERFSNVDLGLIATATVALGLTGLVAIIRR